MDLVYRRVPTFLPLQQCNVGTISLAFYFSSSVE